MEVKTVPASQANTGSRTIADIVLLAGRLHADRPALRHRSGDRWVDVSYRELAEVVKEVALGLADFGIERGDRVSILSNSRPEWTYANFGILAAGAASVSIYQTNSPEECRYVLGHSDSRVVFVEDAEQLAKVRHVQSELPNLELVVVMDPSGDTGDAISLDDLRERGRGRDDSELEERATAVGSDDTCLYIYTSGTTGPPKGCILTHGNYRAMCDMVESQAVLAQGEVVYLFLPLAHAFAILVQFVAIDLGATIAYWEKDPLKIVPNLSDVKPAYFPSVPRIFEKIYTQATARIAEAGGFKEKVFWWSIGVGSRVRELERDGRRPGFLLARQYAVADKQVLSKVRGLFGGELRQAVTGAAPIAREILEFFFASGVPVLEAYGMTETSTGATINTLEDYRLGSVGKPFPGVEVEIAEDGEVLLRGANMFQGYYKDEEATAETLVDGWLHTGDLGYVDGDGFLFINGRKKDILITAGGKNITPTNLENGLKQNRWISQAVVVGDRRPYLVALLTLDPEEAPAFAQQHGIPVEELPSSEAMRAEIQRTVDAVNADVGRVEQIKRFVVLPHDLTQETGELTPTLKVKRNVVSEKYERDIEALYAS
ncbi:MAG: long-chain fatty acid--CoA ligase [Thermoleophilaceae bacterium]|nr:long-chain fatty acid--CoA ligase [Thermoleophilaceae bacterium]